MKTKNRINIFLFCFLVTTFIFTLFVFEGLAQQKKTTQQETGTAVEKEEATETVGETEMESREGEPGEFVYRPKGRRDPFWDLLQGKDTKLKKEAKEGIAGLEIEQLELEGIVFREDRHIALFKGPDGKPYDVKVGQSVYDGEIIKIDANRVVFKKILTIALGGTKEKTVIKWLNPEKEKEQ